MRIEVARNVMRRNSRRMLLRMRWWSGLAKRLLC
jgi:hypothetical protein